MPLLSSFKEKLHRKHILCQKISTNYLSTFASLSDGLKESSDFEYLFSDPHLDGDFELQMEASHIVVQEMNKAEKYVNNVRRPFLDFAEKYQRYTRTVFPAALISEQSLRDEFVRSRIVKTLAESKHEGIKFHIDDFYT